LCARQREVRVGVNCFFEKSTVTFHC
jgi:hypothetical protein